MSGCKNYPADTVDIYGNVWPTVGENIRNGILGKIKAAKISINRGEVTSKELKIGDIFEYYFELKNVKGIFLFVDKVYGNNVSFRFTYSRDKTYINSVSALNDIETDLTLLYKDN